MRGLEERALPEHRIDVRRFEDTGSNEDIVKRRTHLVHVNRFRDSTAGDERGTCTALIVAPANRSSSVNGSDRLKRA